MIVISVVGRGRIVVWEGASLWLLKSQTELADLQPHAHYAIQITFQLEGSFEIGVFSKFVYFRKGSPQRDVFCAGDVSRFGAFQILRSKSLA